MNTIEPEARSVSVDLVRDLNAAQLADAMQVNPLMINRWVSKGVPHSPADKCAAGRHGTPRLFNLAEVRMWRGDVAALPRDRNHPDFPLIVHRTCKSEYWGQSIKRRLIGFGSLRNDPAGFMAWRLYEIEREQWDRGENPRAAIPCRRAICRVLAQLQSVWLLAGPLEQIGLAIIDVQQRRLMCLCCYRTWLIRFGKSGLIEKRSVTQCPQGCTSRPEGEVREAINLALRPHEIEPQTYTRLVKAKREGWMAAPQDVDAKAEAEGEAIRRFVALYFSPRPRRRVKNQAARREVVSDGRLAATSIEIQTPAFYQAHRSIRR